MATWDDVDVDFGGDETGNFGPRLESGSALYQVDTAATISPKGEVGINSGCCLTISHSWPVNYVWFLKAKAICLAKATGIFSYNDEIRSHISGV